MTTTDKLLLLGGVALAAAAVIYWKRSAPAPHSTAGPYDALSNLAGLPDASGLPVGTKSADGRWVVVLGSKTQGGQHWQSVGAAFGSMFG